MVKFALDHQAKDEETALGSTATREIEESPVVSHYVKTKHKHYAPMLEFAEYQKKKGKRRKTPLFRPAIITHLGEMSRDMVATVEWLTGASRYKARNQLYCTTKEATKITSEFRNQLKDSLITAVAAGFGRSLTLSGYKRLDKGNDYM